MGTAIAQVLSWIVIANDPNDRTGVLTVWKAAHSRGVPIRMLAHAFPRMPSASAESLVEMDATDVFRVKSGGQKGKAIEDAYSTGLKIVDFVEEHGNNSVIWGSGGGMDRIIQCCSRSGWFNPENMRPLTFVQLPERWDECGIRKTLEWEEMARRHIERSGGYVSQGRVTSIQLSEHDNGTGTYLAEIWRGGRMVQRNGELVCEGGRLVHTFMIGVYPHPGSQSWGSVENNAHQHARFLRAFAFRTPSQERVIRFHADGLE